MFEIKQDGRSVFTVRHQSAKHYNNVKVWIAEGRHHYPAANAHIRHLNYQTGNRQIIIFSKIALLEIT